MAKFLWQTVNNKIHFLILYSYLKSSHVSWISSIFQTILVAFQKEFEEKPAKEMEQSVLFIFIIHYCIVPIFTDIGRRLKR